MSAEVLAAAVAALASIASQYNTNMTNRKIAKDNIGLQLAYNADQVAVAQMNNQTQIDMANTAHQREVNDLRDAGLNPILSATGGNGAAMPSLSGPNGTAAPNNSYHEENPLKELGVSAREIGKYLSRQYDAQVKEAEQSAEALRIDNQIQKQALMTAKRKGEVDRTYLDAEYQALYAMRHRYIDDSSGKEMIMVSSDGHVELNDDYIDDLVSAIKADLHNRKWSDVQKWLNVLSGAASSAAGAVNSGASAARTIQRIRR